MNKYIFNILLLITLFGCSSNSNDEVQECGVFEGDLFLRNQSQVNDFGKCNYTTITGNLFIDDKNPNSLIEDLTPLSSLTSIEGDRIEIGSTANLKNLNGLNNVYSTATLVINSNAMLENLDALGNLEPNQVELYNNWSLENIDGLTLESNSIFGIYISNCLLLTSLNCFSSIKTVHIGLNIRGNPKLTNLYGLHNIESIGAKRGAGVCCGGALEISGNSNLESIELNSLTSLYEGLSILNNNTLLNLKFSSQLSTFTGDLKIYNNINLSSIDGLSLITRTAEFMIYKTAITNLDALSNLTTIGGNFSILSNFYLTDFCGLQNLITSGDVLGLFRIKSNAYNPSQDHIIDGRCSQ